MKDGIITVIEEWHAVYRTTITTDMNMYEANNKVIIIITIVIQYI
jgi:hypothetical protein